VKSSTVTQVTNDESRYTWNDTSLMWLYSALICSVLILILFILFRSNLTAAIPRR
jgi:Flp pilus assembly protein protease CpaA